MSVKYVQIPDNKYIQYRLMSDTFNTTPANWQGVDKTPIRDSRNLIESGGVAIKLEGVTANETLVENLDIQNGYVSADGSIQQYNDSQYVRVNVEGVNKVRFIGTARSGSTPSYYAFYKVVDGNDVLIGQSAIPMDIGQAETHFKEYIVSVPSDATIFKTVYNTTAKEGMPDVFYCYLQTGYPAASTFSTGEFVGEVGIDNEPTAGSHNLVESGGVYNELAIGAVYDISAANNGQYYDSLSDALGTNAQNIPVSRRRPGMSIKFNLRTQTGEEGGESVYSYEYVQYRYMLSDTADAKMKNVRNWDKTVLYDSLGIDKEKTVTNTGTSIATQIYGNFKAGTRIQCDANNDGSFSYYVRVHYTDGTFLTFTSGASGAYSGYAVLEKDADYAEAVRYELPSDTRTLYLRVRTQIEADVLHNLNESKGYTDDTVKPVYSQSKVNINSVVPSWTIDDTTFSITVHTVSPNDKQVGYFLKNDGTQKSIICQTNGGQTYSIPRLSALVCDYNTGNMSVIERSAFNKNTILLFMNVTGDLDRANGPMAEVIRNYVFTSRDTANANNITALESRAVGSKNTKTATASNNQMELVFSKKYKAGDTLKITAYTDNEQSLKLRYGKDPGNTKVEIASFTTGIEKIITLTEDIQNVEVVNYVNAVNGSTATLIVENGLTGSDDITEEKFGETYSASGTASGTTLDFSLNHIFVTGKIIRVKVNSSVSQLATIRGRVYGTGINGITPVYINFTDSRNIGTEWYKEIALEKTIDIIQVANYVDAVSGATSTLVVKTGYESRVSKNEDDIVKLNADISSLNTKADLSYLPDYYNEYMAERIETIRNTILGTVGESVRFAFLTDSHWGSNGCKSPLIVQDLMRRGFTRMAVFGGDVCSATSPENNYWIQRGEIEKQMFLNGSANNYGIILNVKGNHDFNGSKNSFVIGNPNAEPYYWSAAFTRNLLTSSLGEVHTNDTDTNPLYYYVDDDVRKIRFFVLYAIEAVSEFSAKQEEWFIGAVSDTPIGYNIIIANHDNCEPTAGLQCPTVCPDVKQLVDAINLRTSGTTTTHNKAFDFTSLTAKILLFISGHTHKDLQTFNNGCVYVCTRADAAFNCQAFLGEDTYTRVKGTITEQAVDFVVVDKDNNDVICRRIGAGADRIFRATKVSVSVGSNTTLTSTLEGTLTWGSYNNDTPWHEVTSGWNNDTPCIPTNTRVSVDGGTVTGVANGQAVVYAKDPNGNREFFNIVVE